MYRTVNLKEGISGNNLEATLIKAAQELSLKTRIIDKYKTEYTLGSLKKEETYKGTTIRLNGKLLLLAEIDGVYKDRDCRWFSISTGIHCIGYGFGSEKLVEEYLTAVSRQLQA